ncbi:MAG: hypothetical protein ACK4SJ_08660 [Sphingorhabdus sp.]
METTPRELGSLLAVRISRSAELFVQALTLPILRRNLRSPLALGGHMVAKARKSKKILQRSNYPSPRPLGGLLTFHYPFSFRDFLESAHSLEEMR